LLHLVIPGRAKREPGIQTFGDGAGVYPSSVAHPGMTEKTPMDDELRDRLAIRDLIEN
jgi:hypothetical protein